mmetsp:Transcript_25027/g.33554  ORF Transcript_25027/g.33554 Transcript_25027/m.33554 type:complete len:138 (-) Transcript_25027:98-511(-)|eukprot:CAMPEP_0185596272 /NCGR_PEP_ID=MMETSP0434-20130131/80661_1 /TAXON_ID=626734 ORGANISM="Favella taraikaensis, Strain Fe Narragansett Bay" /NCGR_SAMPLE_ID=MMETSP0434 /ASSEMBLY_ACC=CAM_ASM_000379 /LENGTH=137 /DNA_ID=CAMNT_0028224749 /DNA_START=3534 /DNA_END=3947 /DNA_ORIENTATION=-
MSDDEYDGRGFRGGDDDDDDHDEDGEDVDVIEDGLEEEEKQDDGNELGGIRRGLRKVPSTDRITSRFMTKYERARILGSRALQISKNAPLMVDPGEESDPYKLAEMELDKRKVPFIVRRYLPDGSYEDWKVSELLTE